MAYVLYHGGVADAAYIAGIIDGEGCISLSKKKDPTMRNGYGYRPFLLVSNTHEPLLRFLQKNTGLGRVYKKKAAKAHHKSGYTWQLWSQQASAVLKWVRPYLRVRHKQADLVIRFAEQSNEKFGMRGLPPHIRKYQRDAYTTVRRLNKRGV